MAMVRAWPDDIPKDHVRRVLECAGIEEGVAYMQVPRCLSCKYWGGVYETDEFGRRPCSANPGYPDDKGFCGYGIDDPCCCLMTKGTHGCVIWKMSDAERKAQELEKRDG